MLRIPAILLLVCSATYAQLIIDPNDPWGKTIIDKMMVAVNQHEEFAHLKLTFNKVVNTLGADYKYTVYLALFTDDPIKKQLSCTVEISSADKGVTYNVTGRTICQNDNETTTTPRTTTARATTPHS